MTYRPELDGLRGIAVLAVMAFHFRMPEAPLGFLGVDVFFVLSGFLITGILVRSDGLGRFYLRRAQRLLPALLLMLLVVGWTQPVSQVLVAAGYVENLSAAFGWQPMSAVLGHTWSLAAEWQFYLVWPLALVWARRRWSLPAIGRAVLILGLLSAAWQLVSWNGDWPRSFAGPDTHAAPILIGCALALGVRVPFPRWGIGLILVPLAFGLPWLAAILPTSLATASIIQRPPAWLSFRPLVWVGTISYGLYLWHVPILNTPEINAMGGVVVILSSFLAAFLSYRFLEAPILRLRRPAGTSHALPGFPSPRRASGTS